jgi:hypothetical protein
MEYKLTQRMTAMASIPVNVLYYSQLKVQSMEYKLTAYDSYGVPYP